MTAKKVCIFASSSNGLDEAYYKDSAELGKLLALNDFDMVYGGSSLGMMWACAEAVKNNGGNIYGVMPEKLFRMDVSTDACTELIVTPCMRSRKAKMDELSQAIVSIAGGFGTLEELSEMIVQKQLGYNNKPIVLLNTNGFYDNLIKFFEVLLAQNFAKPSARELYHVAQTPAQVVDYLLNYDYSQKMATIDEIYICAKQEVSG